MPQEDTERAEHFVSVSIGDGQADSGQNHFGERPECTTRAGERKKQHPTRKASWGMAFDPSDGSLDVAAEASGPSENLGVSQLAVT